MQAKLTTALSSSNGQGDGATADDDAAAAAAGTYYVASTAWRATTSRPPFVLASATGETASGL